MRTALERKISKALLAWSWVPLALFPITGVAEDLQVNDPTTWGEERPTLAMNPSGKVVIAWASDRAEGEPSGSILERLYGADSVTRFRPAASTATAMLSTNLSRSIPRWWATMHLRPVAAQSIHSKIVGTARS